MCKIYTHLPLHTCESVLQRIYSIKVYIWKLLEESWFLSGLWRGIDRNYNILKDEEIHLNTDTASGSSFTKGKYSGVARIFQQGAQSERAKRVKRPSRGRIREGEIFF